MVLAVALAVVSFDARAEEDLFDFLFGPDRPARAAPHRAASPARPHYRPPAAAAKPRPVFHMIRFEPPPARQPSSFRVGRLEPPTERRPTSFRIGRLEPASPESSSHASDGFCVRVCDGYFFPLIKSENATRQQSCEFACPSAPMAIYEGSTIEGAHSRKGVPYTRLPTAFQFRDKPGKQCACSRPETALAYYARVARNDPTLRRGDVLIAANGALVYSGGSGSGAFTPLARAGFVPGETRRKLWALLEKRVRAPAASTREPQ